MRSGTWRFFLCGKCGHVREVPSEYIGRSVDCPKCKRTGAVHDTVKVLERLIDEYRAQRTQLRELSAKLASVETAGAAGRRAAHRSRRSTSTTRGRSPIRGSSSPWSHGSTNAESSSMQNQRAMDTTGFFDEVAVQLGDAYETLKLVRQPDKVRPAKGIQCGQDHVVEERRGRDCRPDELLPGAPSILVRREVLLQER